MITSRKIGAAAAAVVLSATAVVTLGAVGPADAAGRSYGTVQSLGKAKLEACKVEVAGADGKYRVYARLDNTANKPRVEVLGRLRVLKDGRPTAQTFNTGYTRGGRVSKVGDVVIKDAPGIQLEVAVSERNSGNGGIVALRRVHDC